MDLVSNVVQSSLPLFISMVCSPIVVVHPVDLFLGFGGLIVFALKSGVRFKIQDFCLVIVSSPRTRVEWWFTRVVV